VRLVLTGLRAWLVQRATAVYLLGFIVFFIAHFAVDAPVDYAGWRAFVATPWAGVVIVVAFVALLLHAWIGLRDVMLDYVKPIAVRAVALPLVAGGLVACGLYVLLAVGSVLAGTRP
jgi:succinate dehydrogenase membrane anchor subunit